MRKKQIKVISGGQTGIDQYALEIAQEFGFSTGGSLCKGWETEDGPQPELSKYGLVQCKVSGYSARTRQNVCDSSLTIILTPKIGPGSKLTKNTCEKYKIPYLINPDPGDVKDTIERLETVVINFAGSRASKMTKGQQNSYRRKI